MDKYLLDISLPKDSHVPLEVFIAFPKTLTDKTVRETVRKEWLQGNDKQYVAMQLMFKREISLIYRSVGVLIDWKSITIQSFTPSGLAINIPNQLLKTMGVTIEQQLDNLNDYLFVTIRKQEKALIATECIPLRGTLQVDIANEIMDKTRYTPLEVLVRGLGYMPKPEVQRLFLPRLLTWFKGFDGKPMHVAQFTEPETAKTHFAIRCETLWNWRYIPEPPTLARLILDARQGILGEVFLRNGIVFDEFDKWDVSTQDRKLTFDSILTGMEQGKWVRGVSALGVRTPDIVRLIPIMFFGNLGDFKKIYGVMPYITRAWFTEIFSRRLTHDVSALADRLAIIDCCFIRIPIMDYLTYKVLPDSIIRGIVSILQKQVRNEKVSNLKGRLRRHSNNLHAIFKTFSTITPELADAMVAGTYEWDKETIRTVPPKPKPPQRDAIPQQKPEPSALLSPLQKQAKTILNVITQMQKITDLVEIPALYKTLVEKYQLTPQQFKPLISQMLREGVLFQPREGYIKRT